MMCGMFESTATFLSCKRSNVVMAEFIRMMRYSGTGWQVCHATHYLVMACHIVYGRPYCNDAKEGVGGITPPKLNRGG